MIVRQSSSNGSPPSISAELPASAQTFNRSSSPATSMTHDRRPSLRIRSISAVPEARSRERTSRRTRVGLHAIPPWISGSRGSMDLVVNPWTSSAPAMAPASKSLPATRMRAGIPRRSGNPSTAPPVVPLEGFARSCDDGCPDIRGWRFAALAVSTTRREIFRRIINPRLGGIRHDARQAPIPPNRGDRLGTSLAMPTRSADHIGTSTEGQSGCDESWSRPNDGRALLGVPQSMG